MRDWPSHGGCPERMLPRFGLPADSRVIDFSANLNPLGPPPWLPEQLTASLAELQARVGRHRRARGEDWITLEEPVDLLVALDRVEARGTLLLDYLTLWASQLLYASPLSEAQGTAMVERMLVVTHGGVIRELRRRFEGIGFWDGGVSQAEGRLFTFIHDQERWQCSSSSAVPAPANVTS